ncbi:L,D-transpeptidase family protein [Clostridium saccharobutylicum]|nr:L,D-transpeptidase family protein [Clostridium saccharobutylicum]MBC2413011.1 L,D-transpeptidase family protein [Clostridium saccharobutylicum]MBC2440351.1 L,D-transpeptidase family protein [Clostridium saccharobutylicum]MBC2445050.1 L,D-transpeptidase family protein [Clostridium saccharobutylicum]MBC2449745.1 L,D-transpeptidase family protein [Clostridium saccharobutylicum]
MLISTNKCFFTFLSICFCTIIFYIISNFYLFPTISCSNFLEKNAEEVKIEVPEELKTYILELKERGNNKEQITATDIGLKYSSQWKTTHIKDKKSSFQWLFTLFDTRTSKITQVVDFDEVLLKKALDNLSCFDENNIIEPQNPIFKYTENGYEIIDEVYGNKINKDILYNYVKNAILKGETIIDLESINCYEKPQYTSKSQEVIAAKDMLNKYVMSEITYKFGESKEVLDKSIINEWLTVDDNYQIIFDKEKIKKYLHVLSNTYDTVGKIRNFSTSLGKMVKVSGGDYGWAINIDNEMNELINIIKEGKTITRQPVYKQTAIYHDDNDIGNTYVEINMTKQHLWFYKNGTLVAAGDVVTGNISRGHSTPVGIYRLKFKQKNAVLKGESYRTPVKFWMPFNGGIGIHDASWRSQFGGDIYKTSGSHGCVNAPNYLAGIIFNNIEEDTPIVCYYE